MIRLTTKQKIIILIFGFVFSLIPYIIISFNNYFSDLADAIQPKIESTSIYHKILNDCIFITKISDELSGSNNMCLISVYKKNVKNWHYDYKTDYMFLGWYACDYYALTDSSIVFFVDKKLIIPNIFNSKIKIEQIVKRDNPELFRKMKNKNLLVNIPEQFYKNRDNN